MYRVAGSILRCSRRAEFPSPRRPCSLPASFFKFPEHEAASSRIPLFWTFRSHFATKGGPPSEEEDEFAEFDDSEDEDDHADTGDWDYETWNLLHQGRKPGQQSRRWPLPLYKAREMVDYHYKKNHQDGLEIVTDPKKEEELRRAAHEGLVDFFKKAQAAFDEIDSAYNKKKEMLENKKKEKLQLEGKGSKEPESKTNTDPEAALDSSESKQGAENLEASMAKPESEQDKVNLETSGKEPESKDTESEPASTTLEGEPNEEVGASVVAFASDAGSVLESESNEGEVQTEAQVEAQAALTGEDGDEKVSMETHIANLAKIPALDELENAVKDVFGVSEDVSIVAAEEGAVDDGVNVFDYDKWNAYRMEQLKKKEEEEKNYPSLRWRTRVVLGPGKAWHPANRKVMVSIYVNELGLSKYAKMRLMALAGKRYKSTKDELTIVSERYQHRYENQKDVLRTLLNLIDEAKKADKLVSDAKLEFYKAKKSSAVLASKALENGAATTHVSA